MEKFSIVIPETDDALFKKLSPCLLLPDAQVVWSSTHFCKVLRCAPVQGFLVPFGDIGEDHQRCGARQCGRCVTENSTGICGRCAMPPKWPCVVYPCQTDDSKRRGNGARVHKPLCPAVMHRPQASADRYYCNQRFPLRGDCCVRYRRQACRQARPAVRIRDPIQSELRSWFERSAIETRPDPYRGRKCAIFQSTCVRRPCVRNRRCRMM